MIRVKAIYRGHANGYGFVQGSQYTLDFSINDINRVVVKCGKREKEYDNLRLFLFDFDVIQ